MSKITRNERLVYWTQSRERALRNVKTLVFFLAVAAIGLVAQYKVIVAISLILAAFSTLRLVLNGLSYARHGRRIAEGDDPETWDDLDYLEHLNEPDMLVRSIDLGVDGVITFCYSEKMPDASRACAERVYERISAGIDKFLGDFARFKQENALRYPKYAALILSLKIGAIDVSGAKAGGCVAAVIFKDGMGEIWGAEVQETGFSELIWYSK